MVRPSRACRPGRRWTLGALLLTSALLVGWVAQVPGLPGLGLTSPRRAASSSPERGLPPLHPSVDDYPAATLWFSSPRLAGDAVLVEARVANTPGRREHGLMEVRSLPDGVGMLFVFVEDTQAGFWMKNTLIPLDIAFIDATGQVRAVRHMEPCTADPCPVYEPGVPYRHALEVPGGWLERNGIGTGWRMQTGLPPVE